MFDRTQNLMNKIAHPAVRGYLDNNQLARTSCCINNRYACHNPFCDVDLMARVVPFHEHLIEQGFVTFVRVKSKGRSFATRRSKWRKATDATNPHKPRYVKAREHLAAWVHALGVDDPELQPNHAWRHTFKQIAHRHGISEHVSDWITGHSPATVGRGYGAPTLADMAAALEKFRATWCSV
jgi:hypothetical protein